MRQDQLLYGALVSTLASNVAPLITQAETTQEAWEILEEIYAKPSRGHINQLKEKIKNLKKVVIDVVQNRGTTISFSELHEKLINKELQLKHEGMSSPLAAPATAMMMQSKPKSKHRSNANTSMTMSHIRPWNSQPYYPSPPQYQPSHYSSRPPNHPFHGRCQWCRKTGHVVAYYPIFRQAAPHLCPPTRPSINHNYAPSPQVNASTLNQPWLVDSGASHHVTNEIQNLSLHYPCDGTDEVIFRSDTKATFINFKAIVEKYFYSQIKILYSDNGGEYTALASFPESTGVSHHTSPPHTPQHNG
ncbi:hypothetical protein AgCh_039015 [Apium graveolens]